MTTHQCRMLAVEAITAYSLSKPQACRLLSISRTGFRYKPMWPDDMAIIACLLELDERKPRQGLGKMVDYLRYEEHPWNYKRIGRVYRPLQLHLPNTPEEKGAHTLAAAAAGTETTNICWSVDFMHDSLVSR